MNNFMPAKRKIAAIMLLIVGLLGITMNVIDLLDWYYYYSPFFQYVLRFIMIGAYAAFIVLAAFLFKDKHGLPTIIAVALSFALLGLVYLTRGICWTIGMGGDIYLWHILYVCNFYLPAIAYLFLAAEMFFVNIKKKNILKKIWFVPAILFVITAITNNLWYEEYYSLEGCFNAIVVAASIYLSLWMNEIDISNTTSQLYI